MTQLHTLCVIGAPGVGKSTLVARLVGGQRRRVVMKPFAHTIYESGLVQLGRERGNGYGGTDSLSMSVQPKVVAMLEAKAWPRVISEGDRLSNVSFFDAVRAAGYNLDVVLLEAPEEVLEARRAQRGSDQSETWLKGRRTKLERLRPYATVTLDGTLSVEQLMLRLRWHPVFNGNE